VTHSRSEAVKSEEELRIFYNPEYFIILGRKETK
jgi:hypothetical protein